MSTSVIEKIVNHAANVSSGKDPRVKPGQAERFTEAAAAGDAIRQGDLYIVVATVIPGNYERIEKPKAADKQLVPGNTQGAKHCLDALAGVELWRPKGWGVESLEGPFLRFSKERTILHQTHGAVTIPAGMSVQCHYQREYDSEQRRARRAAD